MNSVNAHVIRAKDPEREAIASQLSAFLAAGGIPEIVTEPARQEKMSLSQEARNQATWESRK
jgi:hypothetical protein